MSPQTRDALDQALRAHYESCMEHARECCGMDAFTRTASTPDGSPITETSPMELGHACLCGWADVIVTTPLDLVELAVQLGFPKEDVESIIFTDPKEDIRG